MFRLSIVCGRNPSLTSITRTARSARAPPRARNVEKATWPGVSMKRRPGIRNDRPLTRSPHISRIAARGTSVAPMCWGMPPASRPATPVPRIRSRRVVLPWSTCARTDTIGLRMDAIAGEDQRDDRPGSDIGHQRLEERFPLVLRVVRLREGTTHSNEFQRRDLQTPALESGEDFPDEAALHRVRL